jgi:hypothetical protein
MGNVADGLDDAGKHEKYLLKKVARKVFRTRKGEHFRG